MDKLSEVWNDKWGDRRQEIVVIGMNMVQSDVEAAIDALLVREDSPGASSHDLSAPPKTPVGGLLPPPKLDPQVALTARRKSLELQFAAGGVESLVERFKSSSLPRLRWPTILSASPAKITSISANAPPTPGWNGPGRS